jgi:hypothetical protein
VRLPKFKPTLKTPLAPTIIVPNDAGSSAPHQKLGEAFANDSHALALKTSYFSADARTQFHFNAAAADML